MSFIVSWIITGALAIFGINSASNALSDVIGLMEAGFELFAWPIILGLGYVYAARLRKWRDQ